MISPQPSHSPDTPSGIGLRARATPRAMCSASISPAMSTASAIVANRLEMRAPVDSSQDARRQGGMAIVGTVPDDAIAQELAEKRAWRPNRDAVDAIVRRSLVDDEKPGVGGTERVEVERPVAINVDDECRAGHERTNQRGIRETVSCTPTPSQTRTR